MKGETASMANLEPRKCNHCGKIFVPEHYNAKLCSDECRAAARKISNDKSNAKVKANPIQKRCLVCHNRFRTNRSDVVTCSPRCQTIRRLEQQKKYREIRREEEMKKKEEKFVSIDEFERRAREMNMSYGQYDLYLRMHGKERKNAI